MDKMTRYSDTHVRTVLGALLATDLVLTTLGYGFPGLWFALVHGTPYDDPEGLLRRCAGNWLMFGALQAIALWRWKREPGWLAAVSGARFSDVLTDWSYLWFSTHLTWHGTLGLFAAGPFNLLCGVYLWRAYAYAVRGRTGQRQANVEPLTHGLRSRRPLFGPNGAGGVGVDGLRTVPGKRYVTVPRPAGPTGTTCAKT